jgi:hypothetical protein
MIMWKWSLYISISKNILLNIIKKLSRYTGQLVIFTMFCISLLLPAFTTQRIAAPYYFDPDIWYGWQVLIGGWAGIFDGTLAWYANPVLILTLILLDLDGLDLKPLYIFYFSIIGFLLAVSSILYTRMWSDGDIPPTITDYGPGFYLWIFTFASTIVLSIGKIYNSNIE